MPERLSPALRVCSVAMPCYLNKSFSCSSFLSSFYRFVSDRLDRILPVGISGYEQNLSDLSPGRGSGLLVNEHHEVDSFGNQRATELMRHTLTLIRLRQQALKAREGAQRIV